MTAMPDVIEPPTYPGPGIGTTIDHDNETDEWMGVDKPWNVILWNDDVTPIDIVILALIQVIGLDQQKAIEATMTIHKLGKGIVATESQERAELTKKQLETFSIPGFPIDIKLKVTLEQAA